jgi:hypothetical protein
MEWAAIVPDGIRRGPRADRASEISSVTGGLQVPPMNAPAMRALPAQNVRRSRL